MKWLLDVLGTTLMLVVVAVLAVATVGAVLLYFVALVAIPVAAGVVGWKLGLALWGWL